MDKDSQHWSKTTFIRAILPLKIKIIMAVILVASILSFGAGLLSKFIFVCFIWILASLITTFLFTVCENWRIVRKGLKHQDYPKTSKLIFFCNFFNIAIIALVVCTFAGIVVVIILSVFLTLPDPNPLVEILEKSVFWLNIICGPILVFCILLFDYGVMATLKLLIDDTKNMIDNDCEGVTIKSLRKDLDHHNNEYIKSRYAFWGIDVPILFGVVVTFVASCGASGHMYMYGFATGAIALQLIVANISFSMIYTLPAIK